MNTIQFKELEISTETLRALDKMGFIEATPVQAQSIGPMMENKDLLVQAPTGTGKTCAFGIPVMEGIDLNNRNIQTIILCPTRELAIQTAVVLQKLTAFKQGIRVCALYGGEQIERQIVALRRRPQIIVATPGRMMDHIRRRTARLDSVNTVVLDEADRMLDMGFREDMDIILQSVPTTRQTVLFSATMSPGILRIAKLYQKNAQTIKIAQETQTVECVEQFYSEIRGKAKTPALIQLLRDQDYALSLVFVATKSMADGLASQLSANGFRAAALHGDLRQRQRDIVMSQYRKGQVNVLVATDVAARGIDVNNIDAVINYDIPMESDSYVHRIGRTGRANKTGVAYTFIYPKERSKLREIMLCTKAKITPVVLESAENVQMAKVSIVPDFSKKPGKPSWSGGKSRSNSSSAPSWGDKSRQKRRPASASKRSNQWTQTDAS